jgi:hypothetical protein
VYRVDADEQVQDQVDRLPPDARAPFAELRTMLEVGPWGGDPINADNPDGPVRIASFGSERQGIATHLILDDQRRVDLLQIAWLG